MKKTYSVHFHVHMAYDIDVPARDEEEALEIARSAFENADGSDFEYIDDDCEVTDVMYETPHPHYDRWEEVSI